MTIELWHRQQASEAIDVLCAAFAQYPVMQYILRDSGSFDEDMRQLVACFCEPRWARNIPLYGIRQDGRAAAAMAVSPPVESPSPPSVEAAFEALEQRIGKDAMARIDRYGEACDASDPGHVSHYLGMIGVAPACQGKGYGKRLVRQAQQLAIDDADSTGVMLNTETESNLPFYQSLGFEVAGEADAEHVHTWCCFWAKEQPSERACYAVLASGTRQVEDPDDGDHLVAGRRWRSAVLQRRHDLANLFGKGILVVVFGQAHVNRFAVQAHAIALDAQRAGFADQYRFGTHLSRAHRKLKGRQAAVGEIEAQDAVAVSGRGRAVGADRRPHARWPRRRTGCG